MNELDDLQHAGTKGMKWGVIKWRKPGGKSGKKRPGRLKQEWDSAKRERHWKKVVGNVHNLTTKEISTVARRAGLENEYKKLAKTKADKQSYRLREKMSDQELNRKVGRLRAINSLKSQSDSATKRQKELGMRIAQTGGSLALKAYLGKKTGDKITIGDIYESVANPKAAQTQAVKTILDMVIKKKP